MSAAAKKRSQMKSRTTEKQSDEVTPVKDDQDADKDALAAAPSMSTVVEEVDQVDLGDHACFNSYMIKPSNVKEIWSIFKVKKAMQDFMQWYFRPKSSYEPERVDYNALNILAEYQTYNLEFLRNELALSDEQAANVLEALWSLLEFDPDEKSIEREHGQGEA